MKSTFSMLLAALTCTISVSAADVCIDPPWVVPDSLKMTLNPGTYELVMVAEEGSAEGKKVVGLLHLRMTSSEDKSPKTGEKVSDKWLNEEQLYGWVDIDLHAIGAPMSINDTHPLPDSRDPVYPGVLVHFFGGLLSDGFPRQPVDAPVLTIGTLSNIRTDEIWLDGGGIGLFVQAIEKGIFVGRWGEWGLLKDGSGYFCIREIGEPPAN